MALTRAQLIPLDGSPAIEIAKDLIVVGRNEDCDLQLNHKSVSKLHCVIVKTDGLLILRDLGSTNGTRVNGQRVRRAALLPNDQLGIATFKFRVHLGPGLLPAAAQEQAGELTPGEAVESLPRPGHQAPSDDTGETPAAPIQSNPLPDVYPEEPPGSSPGGP